MTYDDAITALSNDAVKLVKNHQTIGLGSGRAATAFVKSLSSLVKKKKLNIKCVPTSLQIKLEAEKGNLHLIDTVLDKIDIVFDGADQIDKGKNLIKGGGGALLRENILINADRQNQQEDLIIDANLSKTLMTKLAEISEEQMALGKTIFLIVSPIIRRKLAKIIKSHLADLHVLSFTELPETKKVDVIVTVSGDPENE